MHALGALVLSVVGIHPGSVAPLDYLDPGSGSLIVQALIATALSVPFILRRQLKAAVDRLFHHSSDAEGSGDDGAAGP